MADVSVLDIAGSQWNFKDTQARLDIVTLNQKLKNYLTLSPPEDIDATLLNTPNGWEIPYDGILYCLTTYNQVSVETSISTDNGTTWKRVTRISSSVYISTTDTIIVQKGWRIKTNVLLNTGLVGMFYKNRD